MAEPAFARKRAALSTIGSASRGLLIFPSSDHHLVLAGTALANNNNALHALHYDQLTNSLTPFHHFTTTSQIWSLQLIDTDDAVVKLLAAVRDGRNSRAEIWSLPDLPNHLHQSTTHSNSESSRVPSAPLSVVAQTRVDGDILHVRKAPHAHDYLCVTQSGATVVNVDLANLSFQDAKTSNSQPDDKVIDGDWISENSALVAWRSRIATLDVRTGCYESCMDVAEALKLSRPERAAVWVPPYASRISSACSDASHMVYVGAQNGSLRAFDNRMGKLVWQLPEAHNQWITVTKMLPSGGIVSAGTDGVVRCWTMRGELLDTFPQHDDTVTNTALSHSLLASISYDGRIAIHDVPPSLA